eukprot:scaffold2706_cov415-Prasinococcus_capsulatus_cf.AAC.1
MQVQLGLERREGQSADGGGDDVAVVDDDAADADAGGATWVAGDATWAKGLRRLPRHVALIMDGNARWAAARRLPPAAGHEQGVASLRVLLEACCEVSDAAAAAAAHTNNASNDDSSSSSSSSSDEGGGASRRIEAVTVYALSTENAAGRRGQEMQSLHALLEATLRAELPTLQANGIRLWHAGDLSLLPPSLARRIRGAARCARQQPQQQQRRQRRRRGRPQQRQRRRRR